MKAEVIKQAGYRPFVWTVNLPEDMERMLKIRPDGIITDLPDQLQEMINAQASHDTP